MSVFRVLTMCSCLVSDKYLIVFDLLVYILLLPGDSNSGPRACEAGTLPAKPFPQADLVYASCLCLILIAIAQYLTLGDT